MLIDKVVTHKDYNKDTLKNDIALVKTLGKITFTGKILLRTLEEAKITDLCP